jgi:hypothetical protein
MTPSLEIAMITPSRGRLRPGRRLLHHGGLEFIESMTIRQADENSNI